MLDEKYRRIDIQVLRAIAMLVVVFYHADLVWVSSDILGVDVFFVISCFLIPLHLREYERQGRIDLVSFYMNRGRGLVPAALFVLFVVAGLSPLLFSYTELKGFYISSLGHIFIFITLCSGGSLTIFPLM